MNQQITYTPPYNKTSIELDILAKIKIHLIYIDKLYTREEIEIFKPPVHFNIPQSPTPTTSEFSSSPLPESLTLRSQQSISNIPSDYLGYHITASPRKPFNPPDTTERPPYWTTHSFTQGEPNIVNEPIDISSDTALSSLPEALSLPSTPSISQVSPTLFPLIFQTTSTLDTENNHRQISLYD